ncbi:ATP-binding protein [Paenibacillus rhizoplanae]
MSQAAAGWGWQSLKKIVQAHGGTIEVTSTVGEGTTFTVTLPCHPNDID